MAAASPPGPPAVVATATATATLGRSGCGRTRREGLVMVAVAGRRPEPSSPSSRHLSPPCASLSLSLPARRAASVASSSPLTASVGFPPPVPVLQWNLDRRHIFVLNAIACAVAISTSWLFFSAIPALLAFKRAAESLEKLLDVTREELPDTMAAVRLSGMEISDLTMELSDLGQEISQGVRSSTRAVRLAEDRLRRFTTMDPTGAIYKKERGGPSISQNS